MLTTWKLILITAVYALLSTVAAYVAAAVHVAGGAEHCPVEEVRLELRRNGHAALLAGDRVAHDERCPRLVLDEEEAVVAVVVAATTYPSTMERSVGQGNDGVRAGLGNKHVRTHAMYPGSGPS